MRACGGHTVEVWVYDDGVRIEQGEQTVASYPCVYDPRQRRLTAVDARGRQQYGHLPIVQLVLWALALGRPSGACRVITGRPCLGVSCSHYK